MEKSIVEIIKNRKSVRTFDGTPLSQEHKSKIESFTQNPTNPFDIPVIFRVLNAKENGLTSPVITGADTYLAAKVSKIPNFEIAFGYSFENVCLYAKSLGIGTVMLAASINRAVFEQVMQVGENEIMPVASPLGYPAKKRSIRETVMRKGIKADERQPFDSLFFDGSFKIGLKSDSAGVFADALEMARWAPSAVNRQPWRAVIKDNTVHFYEYKNMKESSLMDLQKLDVGIALCHFDLTMKENGKNGSFVFNKPEIEIPEKTEYIVSYILSAE